MDKWVSFPHFDRTLGSSSHRGGPSRRPVLCPELPSGVLGASTEDADGIASEGRVELVHGSPGPFPLLAVKLAP